MQVIGQYDHRNDVDGMGSQHRAHYVAKQVDLIGEQCAAPIFEIDREEVGGAGDVGAAISHAFIGGTLLGLMKPQPNPRVLLTLPHLHTARPVLLQKFF